MGEGGWGAVEAALVEARGPAPCGKPGRPWQVLSSDVFSLRISEAFWVLGSRVVAMEVGTGWIPGKIRM